MQLWELDYDQLFQICITEPSKESIRKEVM